MGYLSKQALSGLKHYAYKPGGYTILDNWHQPFWNCASSCGLGVTELGGMCPGMRPVS